MSHFDLLPDELILEVFKFLKGESVKMVRCTDSCTRVHQKLIENINLGNIDPNDWFQLIDNKLIKENLNKFINSEAISVTVDKLTRGPYGKYYNGDATKGTIKYDDIDQILDDCPIIGSYLNYVEYDNGYQGSMYLIYQIEFNKDNKCSFVKGKKYYILRSYDWDTMSTKTEILYNEKWKNFWNLCLDQNQRWTVLRENGYIEKAEKRQ